MTDVVYTAIYGGRDPLRPVPATARRDGVRFLCFTDDPSLKADGWEVIYLPGPSDHPPWLAAKVIKILGEPLPDETTRSIWLDGSIVFSRDPFRVFHFIPNDLGLFQHNARDCIYHEARECIRRRKDHAVRIERQMERYRDEGHPPRSGLWMGGFLFRRHTEAVKQFNEAWWEEIQAGSRRDQLSLPYVLKKTGIKFNTLSGRVRGKFFRIRPHSR